MLNIPAFVKANAAFWLMQMPIETSKIRIQQSSIVNQIAARVASECQSSAA
jgi:hypothetical protein